MKLDGSNGCHVAFAAKEYVAGGNGLRLDATVVHLVDFFLPDSKNWTTR
jgi:hypothetical protein